jgi:hypothetical protein
MVDEEIIRQPTKCIAQKQNDIRLQQKQRFKGTRATKKYDSRREKALVSILKKASYDGKQAEKYRKFHRGFLHIKPQDRYRA